MDEPFDGASRKKELREKTVNWINNNIGKNSKIIDFGCGPPDCMHMNWVRLDIVFWESILKKESINYANKNKRIKDFTEYKYGNYLKENFEEKYDAALMIWCDFGALIPNKQKILLDKIRNLLVGGGLFIFDIFGTG